MNEWDKEGEYILHEALTKACPEIGPRLAPELIDLDPARAETLEQCNDSRQGVREDQHGMLVHFGPAVGRRRRRWIVVKRVRLDRLVGGRRRVWRRCGRELACCRRILAGTGGRGVVRAFDHIHCPRRETLSRQHLERASVRFQDGTHNTPRTRTLTARSTLSRSTRDTASHHELLQATEHKLDERLCGSRPQSVAAIAARFDAVRGVSREE
jgi:hypothetical protein